MSQFVEFLFPVLKFGGIFISGLLGVSALLVEFRKDGKITPWGKKALIGIVLAFVFSALIQIIEDYNSKKRAAEEDRKTQKMLTEIKKNLHPINPTEISGEFSLEFPSYFEGLEAYKKKLDDLAEKCISDSNFVPPRGIEISEIIKDVNVDPEEEQYIPHAFLIHKSSDFYPKEEEDPLAYRAFVYQGLYFEIYKNDNYESIDSLLAGEPDLRFTINDGNSYIWYSFSENHRNNLFEIEFYDLKIEMDEFRRSNRGRFSSLLDLSGAYVIVTLYDNDHLATDDYLKLWGLAKIPHIKLNIGNRSFFISSGLKKLHKSMYAEYVFQFPDSILVEEVMLTELEYE